MGRERGNYCIECGDFLPNEKFSGSGHRKHLCKDCNRKGKKVNSESTSDFDRKLHQLSKAIRNCMIVYMRYESFFLFEYQSVRYIIVGDEFSSEIFEYRRDKEQKFFVSEKLQKSEVLMEVLYKKYYDTMDNGHSFDYEELVYDEFIELSKKRKQ